MKEGTCQEPQVFSHALLVFSSKKNLELFRPGSWFSAALPKAAFVCLPGFIPGIHSGGPMGLISSDGCTDNDFTIAYPRVGAEEDTDNYPRFLVW